MRLSVMFVPGFLVLLSACAGSSAPSDGPSASTAAAATATVTSAAETPPATGATNPAPAATDPNLCALGKSDTWSSCIGKHVEVRGNEPKMVYQHPMIAPMGGPSGPPGMHQSYVELSEGQQIIVVSKLSNHCSGAKRVKGTLREVKLGGAEGTKDSYKGWSIEDATITCE